MNADEIKKNLNKKFDQIIKAYNVGIYKGLSLFYNKIVKEQMSGRPGLNRRSGNLSKGWFIKKEGEKLDSVYKLKNREHYGAYHQHDNGFNGIIKSKNKKFLHFFIGKKDFFLKQVFLPKRLTVYETFNKIGGKLIIDTIKSELKNIWGKE